MKSEKIQINEIIAMEAKAFDIEDADKNRIASKNRNSTYLFRDSEFFSRQTNAVIEEDDTTNFFNAVNQTDCTWTIHDELRLQSVDSLHYEIISYHTNIHQKNRFVKARPNTLKSDRPVANYVHFNSNPRLSESYSINGFNCSSEIEKIHSKSSLPEAKVLWIDILDITILDELAETFGIHALCKLGFKDLRTRPNVTATDAGTLLTLCYFIMDKENNNFYTSMVKAYIYIKNNVVITFETTLMSNVDSHTVANSYVQNNPLMKAGLKKESFATKAVLSGWKHITTKCVDIGPMFIFYEMLNEIICIQDPILEFISRSSFYFKQNMHVNIKYRQKMLFMKKINTIRSTISMLHTYFDSNKGVVKILSTAFADVEKAYLQSLLSQVDQTVIGIFSTANSVQPSSDSIKQGMRQVPYLLDALDSICFVCECLENERVNVNALVDALDKINALRANNASVSC